jgi:hypothetical protein
MALWFPRHVSGAVATLERSGVRREAWTFVVLRIAWAIDPDAT